jgi:predicted DsbA family dithiol-disulfide isomerase
MNSRLTVHYDVSYRSELSMKIDVWSDVYCPWCYIGKRRLEKALDQFEHRDQIQIVWHSFQLDPNASNESTSTTNELLAKKLGRSLKEIEAKQAQVTALAAEEGLEYHFDKAVPGNSFDAHQLIHLAATHNLQAEMKERLMKAYFTDGLSVSNRDSLVQLAVEVGLNAEEVRRMLEGQEYAADVYQDVRDAMEIGIHGVPFFIFDEKYAVSGAQQTELFLTALERTWQEFHQPLQVIAAQDTGVCDDESCAI